MATATLDEIRLQQLLSPFQNKNTGVMNTNSALPFINTGQIYQNLQNTDLVNQLIQENQMKANMFSRPNMMNVAGTSLPGGITEIKNQMIEELKPESLGIDTSYGVAPLQNLGIDTSYGVANTPDVIGQQRGVDVYVADDGTPYYIDPITGKSIVAPDTVEAYKRQSGYEQQPNFFQRMFNKASDIYGSSRDLIGTGISSLSNLVTGNPIVGGLMSLISRMRTPMSEYQMRDLQRREYGDELSRIYGPGGIMQGYNPVSMFGRGPLESIINRRNKILARKEADKAYSASNLNKLNKAITDLGGSTDRNLSAYRASRPASERRSTGFGKSGMGRDPDRFK